MAAALVGGAFLSASLQVLFDRLASRSVLDFVRGRKFSDALLKKLKIQLLAVNFVFNDAEEKQITDPLVKAWLDQLKDAAYVADNLLDEIASEVLRWEAEADDSSDQVRNVSSYSLNSFDDEMKAKIEDILDRLEYISKQKDYLGLKQVVGRKPSQRLPTTSLVDESIVYGRNQDKEKIIEFLLLDDASSGHEIDVITIVGMGGLGKTTLTQLVYNDSRMEDCFDMKAWVCVSEEFDVLRVTKTILEAVTPSACDTKDLNLLQVRLKESLSQRKFLLFLDDVWNESYNEWDFLRSPFKFGAKGSKIIITTRSENVASVMGRGPTHHLNHLSDEDCWLLFAKHAFDNNSSKLQELEVIGRKIIEKCKGLPLAAKTLGGLLRFKTNVADWYNILKSELWELSHDKSSILPALRLSYQYLPSHLKCCFAYCSIFPKDYEFEKQQVILLWMAEDFLQDPHRNKQMEDVGNAYFNDLISRSLFQQSSSHKCRFIMHDLVNDLAKYVSGEFCFRLEDENLCEVPEKTRHLSYCLEEFNASRVFKAFSNANALRTFISLNLSLQDFANCLTNQVPRDILPFCKCLRVLSLFECHNITELPDTLGGLKHLRYLDLSGTAIRKLPDSTSSLCNLQTLLLHNCYDLIELPANMGKLVYMRHLDVYGTNLMGMPMHMSKLVNLQTLSTFIVGKHNGSTITELRELNDLHGRLGILNLENVGNAREAQGGNLKDKAHIEELLLQWSIDIEDSQKARDVLDKLRPQTKLKDLTIDNYGGTRFPNWLDDHSFCNLVFLTLRNCKYCLFLPSLGRLPSLRELFIQGFDGVEMVGPEFYGRDSFASKPFEFLETLSFESMPEFKEWFCSPDEGVEFACLRELHIVNCPKLKGVLPDHLPSLTTLNLLNCDTLLLFGANDDNNLQSSLNAFEIPRPVKDFPPGLIAIEDLNISGCLSLEYLPMSNLPTTLKKLSIEECPKLDLLLPEPDDEIQMGHYSGASLHSLTIRSSCDSLKSFPLGLFPKLKYLDFEACIYLESLWILEGVHCDNLASLTFLYISFCPKLESFRRGRLCAPNVTHFSITNCASLKSMPDGMNNLLPSLQWLCIRGCPELESFPEGGLPTNLISLTVFYCAKLTACRMEWGLQMLPNLQSFEIEGGCEELVESFPEEWLLPSSLTSLKIWSLPNLKYLDQRGLQHLSSLQELFISNCSKLQCLPEDGLPDSLSLLKISGCPLLQQWCQKEQGEGWQKIAHIPRIVIDKELIS